jgi:hypothetical protein
LGGNQANIITTYAHTNLNPNAFAWSERAQC